MKSAFSEPLLEVVQLVSVLGQVCISRDCGKNKHTNKEETGSDMNVFIFVFCVVKSSRRNFALNELGHMSKTAHWPVPGPLLGALSIERNWILVLPLKSKVSIVSCCSLPLERCL